MTEFEEPRRVVARRHARRARYGRYVEDLFKGYSLSDDALGDITERMILRGYSRDESCFQVRRRAGRLFFLQEGCVREELPGGAVRLWGKGTFFGEWTDTRTGFYGARGTLLSATGSGLSIHAADVRHLGREYPDFLAVLAAMGAQRYHMTESLYGVSRRSPSSRVANLLLYLSLNNTTVRARDEIGQLVVQHAPGGLVEGPTQADLADALALGRATVEKVLARLRDHGVLMKRLPGHHRTNRFYVIEDRDTLMEIARGA
ncbi:Crp/Fnr family transcriptional regulator [Streptomyces sp. NPDC001698]|uniref:Crp/Fnr family transcriptional regulator n=1 Tax=Streptomyces sp. NPDC001698 TaxID=3364601 RepID=UPI003689630B